MGFSFSFNWGIGKDSLGGVFKTANSLINATPNYSEFSSDREKINLVFKNPAVLKVFALQCDLFSLAKIKIMQNGKEIEKHPISNFLRNPNPFQSQRQVLWDYMFWNMLGNSVLYLKSNEVERKNNMMYFLDTSRLIFTQKLQDKLDRLILSDKGFNDLQEETIEYKNNDGKSSFFKLKELSFITDLTNGVGNWYKGNSRIDALYKIVANSEAGIDSKNINARYLGKYIINGKIDETNVNVPMMKNDEKQEIEERIDGSKKVHAVKSPIDIKRFVEKSDVLKNLDESYLADYYKIGKLYGIPRDVLEAYQSSTFENQEKARGSHISYTLQPKGADLSEDLEWRFGINESNITIVLDWSHLPFMKVFEKDNAIVNLTNARTLESLIKSGVKKESAAKLLGLTLEFEKNGTI
jgi:hypothetical protein